MEIPDKVVFRTHKAYKTQYGATCDIVCFSCAVKLVLKGEKVDAILEDDSYYCDHPDHIYGSL